MHPFPPVPSPDLLHRLEAKQDYLQEFLTATESLKEELVRQNLDEVERLLKRRQELLTLIDQLDRQMAEQGPGGAADQKARASSLIRQIKELCERAGMADRVCLERMMAWRDEMKQQRVEMRGQRRGVHGYARKSLRPPKFLDVIR